MTKWVDEQQSCVYCKKMPVCVIYQNLFNVIADVKGSPNAYYYVSKYCALFERRNKK